MNISTYPVPLNSTPILSKSSATYPLWIVRLSMAFGMERPFLRFFSIDLNMNVLERIMGLVAGHEITESESCKDVLKALKNYQPAEGEPFYQNNGVFYAGDTMIIPTTQAVYVCPIYSCGFGIADINGKKKEGYKRIESGRFSLRTEEIGEHEAEYSVFRSLSEDSVLIVIGDRTYELGINREQLSCEKFSEWFERVKKDL